MGSIFFARHSLIKTLLILMLGLVLLFYLNNFLIGVITNVGFVTSSSPLGGFQFEYLSENVYVTLPARIDAVTNFFVRAVLPLAFWGIVWLRFKEKEI